MCAVKKYSFNKIKNSQGEDEYFLHEDGFITHKFPKEIIEDIEKEAKKWYEYLNVAIGFVSFNFAFAVQGTKNVPLNAILALAWVMIAHVLVVKTKFPKVFRYLRSKDGEVKDAVAKEILNKHLGVRLIFTKAPLFLMGYLYLLLLAIMGFPRFNELTIFGKTFPAILGM